MTEDNAKNILIDKCNGLTNRQIAEKYNIRYKLVDDICGRRLWKKIIT